MKPETMFFLDVCISHYLRKSSQSAPKYFTRCERRVKLDVELNSENFHFSNILAASFLQRNWLNVSIMLASDVAVRLKSIPWFGRDITLIHSHERICVVVFLCAEVIVFVSEQLIYLLYRQNTIKATLECPINNNVLTRIDKSVFKFLIFN